jgi:hypothetical protein
MCYPDIKAITVMTFVSRSACTQISLDNRKKVNNAQTVRGIHQVTASKKLSKSMLFISFLVGFQPDMGMNAGD